MLSLIGSCLNRASIYAVYVMFYYRHQGFVNLNEYSPDQGASVSFKVKSRNRGLHPRGPPKSFCFRSLNIPIGRESCQSKEVQDRL